MAFNKRPRVFLDISIDNIEAGRIILELYSDLLPQTSSNFYHLCVGDKGFGKETNKPLQYKDCLFHRVVKGFVVQAGDFSHNSGIGGESIFGGKFKDEGFLKRHFKAGVLSMANSGENSNGSQFIITLARAPSLDGKHVAFGHVKNGMEVLRAIERVAVDRNDRPAGEVRIARCGDYDVLEKIEAEVITAEDGDMRAALRKRRREAASVLRQPSAGRANPAADAEAPPGAAENAAENDFSAGESSENEFGGRDFAELSEAEKRFFRLREKSREAARETKREVLAEYRRINGKKAGFPPKSGVALGRESFGERSGGGRSGAKAPGKRGGKVVTAAEAEEAYEKRSGAAAEDHSFAAYLRQVERLGVAAAGTGHAIADEGRLVSRDDIDVARTVGDRPEKVAELAKSIEDAQLKRRKFSRRRRFDQDKDISFINRRNEAFNAKVARAFDKYTFEIKGNLERGTAL